MCYICTYVCVYLCVCMYLCAMYVHMCICMYLYAYVSMCYVCTYVHMYVFMCICIYVLSMYICVYVFIYVCIYLCALYVYVCMYLLDVHELLPEFRTLHRQTWYGCSAGHWDDGNLRYIFYLVHKKVNSFCQRICENGQCKPRMSRQWAHRQIITQKWDAGGCFFMLGGKIEGL